jgi:hypothetical protein
MKPKKTKKTARKILASCHWLLVCFLLGSCGLNSNYAQHYKSYTGGLELQRIPASRVSMTQINKSPSVIDIAETIAKYRKQGYFLVGGLEFSGPIQNESEIKSFAASVGGDLVIAWIKHKGVDTGSRMVVGSYTPGRTINTTTIGNTNGNYSGYGTISNNYNNYNYYNSTGNIQGTSSNYSTTYIPGQTTYVRENYQYDVYGQRYAIFVSEQSYRANSKNIHKYISKKENIKLSESELDTLINSTIKANKKNTNFKRN